MNPSPNATPTGGQTDSPPIAERHDVSVWHSAADTLHQPECSCGWRGEFTTHVLVAEAEADGHRQMINNSAKEEQP